MYKKVKRSELPKKERESKSLFEVTPEWRGMKSDLDGGLKKGESCYLRLSQKDWERIGLSGEAMEGRNVASGAYAISRFIKKYLSSVGKKYTVRAYHSDGADIVAVDGK